MVQNNNILEKLYPVSWGATTQFTAASHVVILLARRMADTLAGSEYICDVMENIQKLPKHIQKQKNDFYMAFRNNNFDLTDERKSFDWASKQTYIALANMMTSAALLEIDSCPIEGFDREKLEKILYDEEILDSEHFGVSVMVSFGYRVKDIVIREKTRGKMEEIVKWVK